MCFFFQAEDGIRDKLVTGVQTCALPISRRKAEQESGLCGNRQRAVRAGQRLDALRRCESSAWRPRETVRGRGDPRMNVTTLALIGVVILVAALLSGLVERTRFPQVALFLLLGLVIGPLGLGLVHFDLHSQILQTIATLGLVLVLFTDAVSVNFSEVRRNRALIRLVLGPGTFLTAAIIALAAGVLLRLPPAFAAILGASLASTDPVMMRGLLRGAPDVPTEARHVLALEGGLNDLVLLPIVLVAMEVITRTATMTDWAPAAIRLFLLGPAAGVVIGFAGVAVLERGRRWVGGRRGYGALYSLGRAVPPYRAAGGLPRRRLLAPVAPGAPEIQSLAHLV